MDTHCNHPGCRESTREGKPYCSKHVLAHPYARRVIEEIAAREAEIARVEAGGTPVLNSTLVRETLVLIYESGGATVERLARERGVSHQVSLAIVQAMAAAGMVNLRSTKRGAIIAHAPQRATSPKKS